MAAVCRTCKHPQRAAIDLALVAGGSSRKVGSQFGVNFHAIARHNARCLPAKVTKAKAIAERSEQSEKLEAAQLLAQMLELQRKTDELLERALEKETKHADVARIIRESRENIALIGRLIGAFPREGPSTSSTTIDNRTQIIELQKLSTDDLRALTQALAPRVLAAKVIEAV